MPMAIGAYSAYSSAYSSAYPMVYMMPMAPSTGSGKPLAVGLQEAKKEPGKEQGSDDSTRASDSEDVK